MTPPFAFGEPLKPSRVDLRQEDPMTKQNSPANENKKTTSPRQQAQDKAAKQHDRESPEDRGQVANTKINTTHQGHQQDR